MLQVRNVTRATRNILHYHVWSHEPSKKPTLSQKTEIKPEDQLIPYDRVFVLDPVSGKTQRTPISLQNLLSATNLKTHTIKLVREDPQPVVQVVDRGNATPSKRSLDPHPKNDAIPFDHVYLVDPQSNAISDEASYLPDLLSSIERDTEFIQLVAREPKPLVRVIQHNEAYKKRVSQRKAKMRQPETKHIQCTWHLAPGDLQHKLKKVRSEVVKGNRVEVTFLPKHGIPVPPPLLRNQMINDALASLQEDCKECQPRTQQGLRVVLHLDSSSR